MRTRLLLSALTVGLLVAGPGRLAAAEVKIVLPLQRKAYQTNERIDVDVVRSADKGLAAGALVLAVRGDDGSTLTFTLPVKAARGGPGPARAVEHLHVNGWLLRPGKYTVEAACDGATGKADIEVYSHMRRSSFKLINWGRAKGPQEQLPQGEDSLGYNLFYGHYGQDEEGNFIRAGVDFMANCTMSGGHQMDLRTECDWSDPLVIRGGTRRVVRRAFLDRTRPNVFGVHFYDEPGLTWLKHPVTGENSPHDIPAQVRSYEAAFGRKPIPYHQLNARDPAQAAEWRHWARWKLGLMDAAWQDAQFGVRTVRPDYLSVTQSQYGFSAFTDGYYFNVVRSLPVISGHGGYHDFGPGYWNPSYFLEFARARDLSRPNWYLPTWYGNTTPDQFRLEQYLSFQTNLQGMMSPPDLEPGQPTKSKAAAGIVQANHLMGRLGTIFTTLPVERPPVAVLFSLSQMIRKQTEDPKKVNYAHETAHGRNVVFTYLAGKLMQQPFMVVLDEDVRDGTLAAHHKAIILTSIDYLDPKVITGLEGFAKNGGLVLLTADCKVNVKGGVNLGDTPGYPEADKIASLLKAGKNKEAATLTQMRQALQGAQKFADALRPHLRKAGIKPVFDCDVPGISATRQGVGDIEYLFAVNASHDPKGDPMLGVQAVTAHIGLEADGRPVYDAVHGGAVPEFTKDGKGLRGEFRFGPGQMRVFARTARPIGGVRTGTPFVRRDYTKTEAPIRLELSAALVDGTGRLLSGSAPLRIRVLDPLGAVRYDLYRATDRGTLTLSLPLALNDPAGKWTVKVTELLNNTEDAAHFTYPAVPTASIAAGATRRAVLVEQDRANIFRYFRTHHQVTLVVGVSDYNKAAAERLTRILKPWNIACKTVTAAEANRPRSLSEEEAQTWVGLDYAGKGQIKAGDKNSPAQVGFAVRGPVILLGTPEDNPLIKFLDTYRFLPYKPNKGEMPGPGRGYVAWQRDGVGVLQESITLIAYDADGMAEAVGSLYEMAAGIEPLTPLALPRGSTVTPATKEKALPKAEVAWSAVLPDSVVGLKAEGDKLMALTHAGVLAELGPQGKVQGRRIVEGTAYEKSAAALGTSTTPAALAEAQKASGPRRVVKFAVANGQLRAVAYWGGAVRVVDGSGAVRAAHRLPQDVTALTWHDGELVVGDADGRVVALKVR
jgi:hypothetical protein